MDDVTRDLDALRQHAASVFSEIATLERDCVDLKKGTEETESEHAIKRQELALPKTQCTARDKEIDLRQAHNASLESQIKTYTENVRPQLVKKLKEAEERCEAKRIYYKENKLKYEKIWEQVQAEYNKFPIVAERNESLKRAQEMEMEYMKKKQEVQQREIAKNEYLKIVAEEQCLRQQLEQIQQQVEEKREQIALKKAKRQEEEELQRLKEQEERREKIAAEAANGYPQFKKITIPVFEVPVWEPIHARAKACPQVKEDRGLSVGSAAHGFPNVLSSIPRKFSYNLTSLPGLRPEPSASNTLSIAPVPISASAGVTCAPRTIEQSKSNINAPKQLTAEKHTEFGAAGKNKVQDSVFPDPVGFENPKSKEMNNLIPSSPMSSGGNKKESILSTDNIAAKLKETTRPNSIACEDFSQKVSLAQNPSKVLSMEGVASSSQDLCNQEYNLPRQDTLELMDCGETDNENVQRKSYETGFIQNSSALYSSHSAENENLPMEDDSCYDFNAEYGDEIYSSSLQSPPAFESVMSPVHAGFESPPSKSSDGAPDGDQAASFTGFGFFTQQTNIFEGQSSSEKAGKENDKTSSKFSFLF